jgi:hypothetical protein
VRAIVLSILLCATLAGPAAADTLSLTAGPDPARDSTPVTVHVSGQTAAAQPTVAVYQADGQTCPATPAGTLVVSESVASGAFAADYRTTFAAGTAQLCAYLSDSSGAQLAAAAYSLSVRPLRIELALGLPDKVERNEPFRGDVSYAGLPLTSDAGLWVDVKPDDGRGCAPTRAAEPAGVRDLLTPADRAHTYTASFGSYGRNLVCAWLTRHDGTTLAGPVFATITVAHITGGTRFHGRTSQGLPIRFRRRGHTLYGMTFRVRCSGSTVTVRRGPIVLRHGRFSVGFATAAARGTLRGRVLRRSARGTLVAAEKDCASGSVTWHARA